MALEPHVAAWSWPLLGQRIWRFRMHRYGVNKHKSARKFKSHIAKTKAINMKGAPMRGGIRL